MIDHVFQPGDRILVSRRPATFSAVIDDVRPDFLPGSDQVIVYAWRDDDPERTRFREVVMLTADGTTSAYMGDHVELWDGGINGASTGVSTHDCPVPGCDFNVSAVGTPDPDEPDYFNEDIEQHERSHACLCTYDGEGQSVDAECPKHGDATGALTAPPGVELAPPPGLTPEARQRLADDFAALAAPGSVAHAPSSQAGLASFVPSLVQLDAAETARDELIVASITWHEIRATGVGTAVDVAEEQLAAATAAYRAVTR